VLGILTGAKFACCEGEGCKISQKLLQKRSLSLRENHYKSIR
jgi:hypothetical protein